MRPLTPLAYRSDAWHRMRLDSVGGSDLGAVLGLDPYQTRADLLTAKLLDTRLTETPAMRAGLLLEPLALSLLCDELGAEPMEAVADTVWRDGRRHYTPDAVLVLPDGLAVAEIKTTAYLGKRGGWGPASPEAYDPEAIPQHHLAQVQQGLQLSGLDRGYLVALGRAHLDHRIYRIDADPVVHAHTTREVDHFLADLDDARSRMTEGEAA